MPGLRGQGTVPALGDGVGLGTDALVHPLQWVPADPGLSPRAAGWASLQGEGLSFLGALEGNGRSPGLGL